jgi:hypothetical protein
MGAATRIQNKLSKTERIGEIQLDPIRSFVDYLREIM